MRERPRTSWLTRLGIAILFAVLSGYVVWPMLASLGQTFGADPGALPGGGQAFTSEHWRHALQGENLRAVGASVGLSLISTLLAGVAGSLLAVFFTRWEFPGRSLYAAAAFLPLTLPPLVGVFAFWRLLSETGIVSRFLFARFGIRFSLERGWAGVYLVHGYSFSVYFYMLLSAAIRAWDASTFEAARNLGASRVRVLCRVAVPQLAPALIGASLLVFMASMASFSAPWIYVNGRDVLTLNIFRAINDQPPHTGQAAILSLFMTAASFLFLVALLWWNARTKHYSTGKGVAPRPIRPVSRAMRMALCALGACLTLLLATPHLYILLESFVKSGTWFLEVFPPRYTLENYTAIFRDPDFLRPVAVSLKASAAAAAGVAAFGLLASWLIVRRRFVGRKAAMLLVMLPWALPGTVIALNLLQAFNRPSVLTFGARLYGTVAILALAYFIRYIPLTYGSATASLETLDPNLELAALNLGASPGRTLWSVTLPLVAPGLFAGALLVFVTALGEFVSSILLYVTDTMPIAVKIYSLLRVRYEMAAAYSVLLTGLILLTLIVSSRFSKRGAAPF